MKITAVIPARYQSTRFEGKPLADICGKPMIWWVYNQVRKTKGIENVLVATDDARISGVCGQYGIPSVMTSNRHPTSTERLREAAAGIEADLFICVNGDEPLIDPEMIAKIIPSGMEGFFAANLMARISDPVEAVDSTNIKVVTDSAGNALFMSRSPIPYPKASMDYEYYKHLGVLAYCREALDFFAQTPKGKNERVEDINELRFVEHGKPLKMIAVEAKTLSVDTPKDLERVREVVREHLENGVMTI